MSRTIHIKSRSLARRYDHIIFDIGNVLCRLNFGRYYEVALRHGILNPAKQVEGIEKLLDLDLTRISRECDLMGLSNEERYELLREWERVIEFDIRMVEFKKELESEYTVGILSNIGYEHGEYIKQQGVLSGSKNHLSYEVGARKPQMIYYQSFLYNYPEFKGALYIDDREENLEMGNRMGLIGYHFNLERSIGLDYELDKIRRILKGRG